MNPLLTVTNFSVSVDNAAILHDVSFSIQPGEIHVLMGPNGSGKSTLAYALAGHPSYSVTSGSAVLKNDDLLVKNVEERAHAGLFLSFQQPVEIPGVKARNLLRASMNAIRMKTSAQSISIRESRQLAKHAFEQVALPVEFLDRDVHAGFSGGEKKRFEMAQLLLADPLIAVVDEIDAGLDVDAVRLVGTALQSYSNNKNGLLLITHQQKLFSYVKPTHIHCMLRGTIARSGGMELAKKIEQQGYEWLD